MLALDGNTFIIVVATSALACRAALKPVAGVNLDGWLGGQNLKLTAALRRVQLSRRLKLTSLIVVDHEAVVIPLTIVESREVSLDLLTDFLELPEIHRCTCNRVWLSYRNQGLVSRQIDLGVEFQLVIEDIPVPLAIQIEIGVVGKVHDSCLVGLSRECQLQRIVLAPFVVGDNLQIAGITSLTVLRKVLELNGITFDAAVPHLILESIRTAVQMVRTVVDRQ